MNYANKLKDIWTSVYDPKKDTASVIQKFFHSEYSQCINGVTMCLTEYINHVIAQKKNMVIDHIEYTHVLENKEEVFALYYPKGKTLDGLDIEAEVICYFQFKNEKIIKIHGQVRLLQGDPSDVDMKD